MGGGDGAPGKVGRSDLLRVPPHDLLLLHDVLCGHDTHGILLIDTVNFILTYSIISLRYLGM